MKNRQDEFDKIYVYLQPEYASKLEIDARYFEILKKDNSVNMNHFLNLLVKGYYEQFSKVDESLKSTNHFEDITNTGEKRQQIIIRPTKDNQALFSKIVGLHSKPNGISGYFSRLLISYCELAMYKREQIIFSERYMNLKRATKTETRTRLTFVTKDNKNNNIIHEVIPYKMTISKEEMFNYLLCAELTNGKQVETPFRLTHILSVDSAPGDTFIYADVERHLMKMDQYAPQYQIKDDIETCVRLTDQGIKDYQRIYFGRPERIPEKDETKEDGTYYYFDCSTNQLYLYFRRFGCEAEIIYPEELRNRIKEFHHNATSIYEKE